MNNAESISPPLKVAYLLADAGIQFYSSRKGSSIHARSMIKALTQEGCAVAVYVFRKGERPIPGFNVSQVRQSRLGEWWQRRLLRDRLWRRFWPFGKKNDAPPNWAVAASWLLWHRDLARYVAHQFRKNGRPDLIYARHAWLAFPYARLKKKFKVPLVLEVNAVLTIEKAARREMAFYRLTRWIERRAFQAADLILPVSQELKDQIVSFGVDPAKVVVTPNAVDLDLFHPRGEGDGAGDGFTVGTVNSFKAYHGMDTLLEAAALLKERIPGLKLRMIGDGEELAGLKAKAAALGLEGIAEFTGTIEHERVPELLRQCDACAAPYQGPHNQYNCPMKLYEYMALQVPIVAAAWGDIPNIIEDGRTALLHEPGNPEGLAARIEDVWRDPAAARARAAAAFELAQRHTWRAVAGGILNWHAQHHRQGNKR